MNSVFTGRETREGERGKHGADRLRAEWPSYVGKNKAVRQDSSLEYRLFT